MFFQHPIRKFVGFCNSPNYQVVECLKEEVFNNYNLLFCIEIIQLLFVSQREINSAINREKAKAKKEEVQQRMKQPLSE